MYILMMEYHTVVKISELQPYSKTGMNLGIIILNEKGSLKR